MHTTSRNVLSHASDPMCVPQLMPYDKGFRVEGESYAQTLRDYIEFALDTHNDQSDPMDPLCIY